MSSARLTQLLVELLLSNDTLIDSPPHVNSIQRRQTLSHLSMRAWTAAGTITVEYNSFIFTLGLDDSPPLPDVGKAFSTSDERVNRTDHGH